MLSLFASATLFPAATAEYVDCRPAMPTIAATTRSTGACASSIRASDPAIAAMPVPASRSFRSAYLAGSAIAAQRAPCLIARFARPSASVFALNASTTNAGSSSLALACATTERAERPTEPVAPMMVNRLAISGLQSEKFRHAGCKCQNEDGDDAGHSKTVHPVHDTAMAGDEAACVLHAETTLERGFKKVAPLRRN